MQLFAGTRVKHCTSGRPGIVLEMPDTASGPDYQTHMLIKFDQPESWPPAWRRISAFIPEFEDAWWISEFIPEILALATLVGICIGIHRLR